jgi:hypothetical protein
MSKNESAPPAANDLSDEEMVSRQRQPPCSLIASTGIDFKGLERTDPVPIQPWTTAVTQD